MAAEAEHRAKAGAPEDEIEITPEMIEAGVDVLYQYAPSMAGFDFWAGEIFRAMWAARTAP
jgi:hypothetical protein